MDAAAANTVAFESLAANNILAMKGLANSVLLTDQLGTGHGIAGVASNACYDVYNCQSASGK